MAGAQNVSDTEAIEAATRKLIVAIDGLEAAVERRRQADRSEESLAAQVQSLGVDRSRLAAELDGAVAERRQLELANREIARRLDLAIDAVRTVIDRHDR